MIQLVESVTDEVAKSVAVEVGSGGNLVTAAASRASGMVAMTCFNKQTIGCM